MASWWFAKDDTENTLSSASYVEQLTLDFNAPAQGDYLIIVSCAASPAQNSNSVGVRAQLDDTTTTMEVLCETTLADRAIVYPTFHSVYLAENLASGDHYVDIDAFVEQFTGYIKSIKIAVLRLDDWLPTSGMYDYASTEGELTLGLSFATFETLTFTPDTAGDYLVLGSVELKSGATTYTAEMRLNYDSASEYLPIDVDGFLGVESKDTSDYFGYVWGGIITIPASSKTILLEAKSGSGVSSKIRKRRIFAVRIAAMDAAANTDEDASSTSTTSQWADRSTISFTPSSTEDYLILGSHLLGDTATDGGKQQRLNHTVGTDTGVILECRPYIKDRDAPADWYNLFAAEIKSLTNTLQTFKTQWGEDGSNAVYSKGSWIVAIRKPSDETTAYKDVPLKISVESEDTYKDIPLKVSVESADEYKDVPLKISIDQGPEYKDIPLKISIESSDTYKDIPLKISIASADEFKDVPLKISIESEDSYQDIPLKVSISLADVEVFKDVPLKLSVESEDTYKDLPLKISVESSDEYKDIPLKLSIESTDIYKDIPLKISIDALEYKDIPLKLSVESEDSYKDVPLKVSIYAYQITGVTKDNAGSALGSCEVFLVKDEGSNVFSFKDQTTSDGTGNYTFTNIADNDANYQVIAWKDDAPHVFDVTDWVLQPETI